MTRLIVTVVFFTTLASPCRAQRETPEQVVDQIVAATRDMDWGRLTGLMHPVALRELREVLSPLFTADGSSAAAVRGQMFGSAAKEAAAAASDSAVFVGLLRFTTSRRAALPDLMRSTQHRILGTVPEGGDTVHVVVRVTVSSDGVPVGAIEVFSLMRAGPTWRGLLKADFAAMAAALRNAVERTP